MTQQELQRASELNERLMAIDRVCSEIKRGGMEHVGLSLSNAEDDELIGPERDLVLDGGAVCAWLEAQSAQAKGELAGLGVSVTQ